MKKFSGFKIKGGKVKRKKYKEDIKIRRLEAIKPKGYNGKITIERRKGKLVAKFHKK